MKIRNYLLVGILLLTAPILGSQEQPQPGLPLKPSEKTLVANVVNDAGGLICAVLLDHLAGGVYCVLESVFFLNANDKSLLKTVIKRPTKIVMAIYMGSLAISCYNLKEALYRNALQDQLDTPENDTLSSEGKADETN